MSGLPGHRCIGVKLVQMLFDWATCCYVIIRSKLLARSICNAMAVQGKHHEVTEGAAWSWGCQTFWEKEYESKSYCTTGSNDNHLHCWRRTKGRLLLSNLFLLKRRRKLMEEIIIKTALLAFSAMGRSNARVQTPGLMSLPLTPLIDFERDTFLMLLLHQ